MSPFTSVHTRLAIATTATALLALGAAMPAAAAPAPKSFTFSVAANNDVTNFVPCPAGTSANVMLCGYGLNEPITSATNTGGDQGLSGSGITISFASTLDTPTSTPTCAYQINDASVVTLRTTKGNILLATHDGARTAHRHSRRRIPSRSRSLAVRASTRAPPARERSSRIRPRLRRPPRDSRQTSTRARSRWRTD